MMTITTTAVDGAVHVLIERPPQEPVRLTLSDAQAARLAHQLAAARPDAWRVPSRQPLRT